MGIDTMEDESYEWQYEPAIVRFGAIQTGIVIVLASCVLIIGLYIADIDARERNVNALESAKAMCMEVRE